MRNTILAGALGATLLLPAAASAGGFAVHARAHHHPVVSVHAPIVLVNGHPQRLAFAHHRHALRHLHRPPRAHCLAGRGYRAEWPHFHRHHHGYDRHYRHHARYRAFPQPGLFLSFAYRD